MRKYTKTSVLPHVELRRNKWISNMREYTKTSVLPHVELRRNKWFFQQAEIHYD